MPATPKPLLFALAAAFSPLSEAFTPSTSLSDTWVQPQGLPEGHNGGQRERLTAPAAGKQPHILMILFDDYGWEDRLHTVRPRLVLGVATRSSTGAQLALGPFVPDPLGHLAHERQAGRAALQPARRLPVARGYCRLGC